jgi:aryl-alcohol dehydrogenase-like predicted oxidoreductase
MNFGGVTDEPTAAQIIDEAIDAGVNFIDTADVYGRGASELIVGNALKANGRRDDIVLATKAVASMGGGQNDHGAGRRCQPEAPADGQNRPVLPARSGYHNADG